MINFVLNSLNGGGALNLITPVIGAVVFTIIIILFDLVIKPKHNNTNEQH
ncbi:hypothetical protein SSME_18750 [Staphylococcus saprophyticus subsp. saprophyticus KACC 16562]|nr:hypothetical protein SSME_18750 [Staphylococcus saprophyticus subsp. saprophyticus KACC 16562]